jgi:hypothetical protein
MNDLGHIFVGFEPVERVLSARLCSEGVEYNCKAEESDVEYRASLTISNILKSIKTNARTNILLFRIAHS